MSDEPEKKLRSIGAYLACIIVAMLLYSVSYPVALRLGIKVFCDRRMNSFGSVEIAGGGPFIEFSESSTINDAVKTFYRPAIFIDRKIRRKYWHDLDPNNRF